MIQRPCVVCVCDAAPGGVQELKAATDKIFRSMDENGDGSVREAATCRTDGVGAWGPRER